MHFIYFLASSNSHRIRITDRLGEFSSLPYNEILCWVGISGGIICSHQTRYKSQRIQFQRPQIIHPCPGAKACLVGAHTILVRTLDLIMSATVRCSLIHKWSPQRVAQHDDVADFYTPDAVPDATLKGIDTTPQSRHKPRMTTHNVKRYFILEFFHLVIYFYSTHQE